MIFRLNPYEYHDKQTEDKIKKTINYLHYKILPKFHSVLDIGPRSPMTDALEKHFGIKIDNTVGNLDLSFSAPKEKYDVIIYSHTIEHQFNPLFTLMKINDLMTKSSVLHIFLPRRGKLLWTKVHYHEIDDYRMRILLDHAGFRVFSTKLFKVKRPIFSYFTGFRPLLRLFFEYNIVYEVIKKY